MKRKFRKNYGVSPYNLFTGSGSPPMSKGKMRSEEGREEKGIENDKSIMHAPISQNEIIIYYKHIPNKYIYHKIEIF